MSICRGDEAMSATKSMRKATIAPICACALPVSREIMTKFLALSTPIRLNVLKTLMSATGDGKKIVDIAGAVGATPPAIVPHLEFIVKAGFVRKQRQSRNMIYKADYAAIISESCCVNSNCSQAVAATQSISLRRGRRKAIKQSA